MTFQPLTIAIEPTIPNLPILNKKPHNFQSLSSISLPGSPKTLLIAKIPSFGDKPDKKPLSGFLKSKNKKCLCPKILVADDDPFQHAYYRKYLESLSLEDEDLSQKLKVSLHFSGEELLKKYLQISQCPIDCKRLKLVIVDYQMGSENLNGVEMSVKLRAKGYKEVLILRSGETKEYLKRKHVEFDKIIQEKIIDVFISKDDIDGGQKIIKKYLTL